MTHPEADLELLLLQRRSMTQERLCIKKANKIQAAAISDISVKPGGIGYN